MNLPQLRNIGIVAHIDAGKTTVTERILFYTGVERRMGEVHEGTAVMDWMEEERRRGITITSAATSVPWRECQLNVIDTPGHVDFTVEVERCLRVLDGAVLVLNGVSGIQAQSETVWRQMERYGVPYVVFVNQCDRPGADYFGCINGLRARLGVPAIPLQYPVGEERGMRTVVDLVSSRAFRFDERDLGARPVEMPVPEAVADEVGVLRAELIEALAEEDEALLDCVVEEREPEPAQLRSALRRRVLARTLVPCLCGAALRNVGIQPLLDAVVDYLPSPADTPPVEGVHPKTGEPESRPPDADAPLAALAFKLEADAHEDLTFVRIYSGTLRAGSKVFQPRVGRMERVSRVLRLHADHRQALEEAGPGEIVALTGMKFTATGDTLCDYGAPIALEPLEFPAPVITQVVEPLNTSDRDKLKVALDRLAYEDPTFQVREDDETGQWLIAGMGELHLEILRNRLESDFHLEVQVGRPRVAYREAPQRPAEARVRIERQAGSKELFGAVALEVEPAPGGGGLQVEWAADAFAGGGLPEGMRASIQEALEAGGDSGPRFGYPLIDLRARVTGGESLPAKDSEVGFAQAAAQALREALALAEVELLEPVMRFEISAPEEFMGGILGDLNSSHAEIADVRQEGATRTVWGVVPLIRMFGYSTTLRSLSQGRASFAMAPAGFRPVPEAELRERGLVWS